MDITEQFSGIRVLGLAARNKNLSNTSRHRELFEQLLNCSDQVREARANSRTLFSAYYFSGFFRCAVDHLAATSGEPFNFIATSHSNNPVSRTLQVHLEDFLRNIKTPQKLVSFAIPVIASSFLLDSYPPDMHCKSTASRASLAELSDLQSSAPQKCSALSTRRSAIKCVRPGSLSMKAQRA